MKTVGFYFADRKIKKIIKAIKNHKLTVIKETGMFYKTKNEHRFQTAMKSFSKIGQKYEVSEACISVERIYRFVR